MSDVDRAERAIDRAIDKYGTKIGYATLEIILQKRAQDCREISLENNELPNVEFEDIEGYNA